MSYSKRDIEKASNITMGVGCVLAFVQLVVYGTIVYLVIRGLIVLIHHFS